MTRSLGYCIYQRYFFGFSAPDAVFRGDPFETGGINFLKGAKMDLSITADYVKSKGCPEPYLKRIANAGFSHVHWAYHYNTDFIYSKHEIGQIAKWLDEYNLKLLDLHASDGREKKFYSLREYERLAGVELVENRLLMAAELGTNVIIIHIPEEPEPADQKALFWSQLHKSMDALQKIAVPRGMRIAVENLWPPNFTTLHRLLDEYDPSFLGLCYDSGHGNMNDKDFKQFETMKDRLISVHLHDNKGTTDDHNLVFSGTIDWEKLAGILARSAYTRCVSMEIMTWKAEISDEDEFLARAFETGTRLSEMIARQKDSHKG